jgi:hypothetical protein
MRPAHSLAHAEYLAVAAAPVVLFPEEPMLGQWVLETEEVDCEPVLVDVVVVDVLVCAKTTPIDETTATNEMAMTEYATMLLLLVLKPILKLVFRFTSQ